jgi:hypothetical protein
VFIPFLYYQVSILFGKTLGFIEIFDFKTLGLTQLDFFIHIKNCFSPGLAHMHMNQPMVIAVECKTKSLLLENQRHALLMNPITNVCKLIFQESLEFISYLPARSASATLPLDARYFITPQSRSAKADRHSCVAASLPVCCKEYVNMRARLL